MWDYGYNEDAVVNLRDSVPGVVRWQSRAGLYIDLNVTDDVECHEEVLPAFGFWTGILPVGTKVLCSIKRQAERNKDILVSIDSIIYEDNTKIVA